MEAGEKELRKVFEDVTTRNVTAVVDHSNETRKLIRELEDKIKSLENMVLNQQQLVAEMRSQLAFVQAKIYAGGT